MCLMVNGKRRVMDGVPVVELCSKPDRGSCRRQLAARSPFIRASEFFDAGWRIHFVMRQQTDAANRKDGRIPTARSGECRQPRVMPCGDVGNRRSARRRRGGGARGRRSAATARGRDLTRSFRRWPECLRARCARCPTLTVAQQCTPPPRKTLASRMKLRGTCCCGSQLALIGSKILLMRPKQPASQTSLAAA